ncbi:unnamed protein product [Cylindrotheca closterium]|uniref:Uncharacterized protein n=1 Tax=Cylindrotheca closterium TaxID=2856 RepID=A0AAD2FR94_9STRA|nr:unnamed protein product [Cylindrotheca closterium]
MKKEVPEPLPNYNADQVSPVPYITESRPTGSANNNREVRTQANKNPMTTPENASDTNNIGRNYPIYNGADAATSTSTTTASLGQSSLAMRASTVHRRATKRRLGSSYDRVLSAIVERQQPPLAIAQAEINKLKENMYQTHQNLLKAFDQKDYAEEALQSLREKSHTEEVIR